MILSSASACNIVFVHGRFNRVLNARPSRSKAPRLQYQSWMCAQSSPAASLPQPTFALSHHQKHFLKSKPMLCFMTLSNFSTFKASIHQSTVSFARHPSPITHHLSPIVDFLGVHISIITTLSRFRLFVNHSSPPPRPCSSSRVAVFVF